MCWQKVPVILKELQDCDYLLFLDADTLTATIDGKVAKQMPDENGDPLYMLMTRPEITFWDATAGVRRGQS